MGPTDRSRAAVLNLGKVHRILLRSSRIRPVLNRGLSYHDVAD